MRLALIVPGTVQTYRAKTRMQEFLALSHLLKLLDKAAPRTISHNCKGSGQKTLTYEAVGDFFCCGVTM